MSVSGLFFLNGLILGCWAPAVPAFKDKHHLTESELGLMILAVGIGSIIAMPAAGVLIAKRGSTPILRLSASFCIFLLPAALLAPSIPLAFIALALFGSGIAAMDVAMNSNAVRVEAHYEAQILSSCHGFWSLGALAGALVGGLALGVADLSGIAVAVAISVLAGVALLAPKLFEDRQPPSEKTATKVTLPKKPLLYVLALMAFAGFTAEGAILDWAALFLRDERALPSEYAGYAFGVFSGMMALVRFVGDPVRARFGDGTTLTVSAGIAAIGFLVAGLAPNQAGSIIGFAIVGLGLANIVPITFKAADQVPGLPKGIGMAVATTFGYSGILLAPPLLGFVAESISFGAIFSFIAILPVYVLVAGYLIVYRSSTTTSTRPE